VLNQRNLSNVDMKGVVKLNGKTANVNNIMALSAYAQQDDLFFGTLKVREHLIFQV
jgi:ABC-type multidrug transport system ATPase subunit